MGDIVIWIIAIIFLFGFVAILGFFGVISSNNKGNNWGSHHMKDLGVEEESKDKDDFKPI